MATYPIYLKRDGYRGSNPARRAKAASYNTTASKLERHINALAEAQAQRTAVYHSASVAKQLGLPKEVVVRHCLTIDGGHNGFTVVRPDLPDTCTSNEDT